MFHHYESRYRPPNPREARLRPMDRAHTDMLRVVCGTIFDPNERLWGFNNPTSSYFNTIAFEARSEWEFLCVEITMMYWSSDGLPPRNTTTRFNVMQFKNSDRALGYIRAYDCTILP